MSSSFVYQPHVHTPEGVLTPDLVVDTLLLARAGARAVPLGLNLLTTSSTLDDPTELGCASAALVIVTGGRGAVATIGSVHWVPSAADNAVPPSEQLTPKPISREAIRLERLGVGLETVTLTTWRRTAGGDVRIAETPLAELSDVTEIVARWTGADAPKRTVLFISAGHSDPEPHSALGYRVALKGVPGVPDLQCAYDVRRLST